MPNPLSTKKSGMPSDDTVTTACNRPVGCSWTIQIMLCGTMTNNAAKKRNPVKLWMGAMLRIIYLLNMRA
jgi:hypothetical protein